MLRDPRRNPIEELATNTQLLIRLNGKAQAAPLARRMQRHGVPGVGIAVIDDGELIWQHSCGVRKRGFPGDIDAATLFQCASLSKLATALATLRLVDRGVLRLDSDVNAYLREWKVPVGNFTASSPVTLRTILNHSSGLSVYRYHGYDEADELPTLLQTLNGQPPASSDAVSLEFEPGSKFGYSEGAMMVEQLLLCEVTGLPFPELMRELVIEPLGMIASSFAQPLPVAERANAAAPHGFGSEAAPRPWRVFPEMAASGLWSSPGDIARMMIAIRDSFLGRPNSLLSKSIAREMLTPSGHGNSEMDFGLGPWISGVKSHRHIGHAGVSSGFNSIAALYLERGAGAVIMTNSANGGRLAREITATLSEMYDWPGGRYSPRDVEAVVGIEPAIGAVTGRYRMTGLGWGIPSEAFSGGNDEFSIAKEDGQLVMESAAFGSEVFCRLGKDEFLSTEGDQRLAFHHGDPVTLDWLVQGRVRGRASRVSAWKSRVPS